MLCHSAFLSLVLFAPCGLAFPGVLEQSGVDASLLKRQQAPDPNAPASEKNCPFNPHHVPAAPVTKQFPYNNAKDGKKGNEKGGFIVPHPDDKAHQFTPPDYSKDIRGPCPGLNTLANHNFIAHDGITTFNELVDAQQNVYNVGHQLAILLTVLGLTLADGDIVTERVSIGCEATNRTSFAPLLTGSQPGLDGHNKFEADTSLSRDDYFISNPVPGDNFSFNATLFELMAKTTGGVYDVKGLSKYRRLRWEMSVRDNPDFYFGPLALLLYGAASFLFELMPSGSHGYKPDHETIKAFFGATELKNGKYIFNKAEQLPPRWYNRVDPFDGNGVGSKILKMYTLNPVLFGGNTGDGQFDVISHGGGAIKDGKLMLPDATSITCLLYQLAMERVPSSLNGVLNPSLETVNWALSKVAPEMKNLGCRLPLT